MKMKRVCRIAIPLIILALACVLLLYFRGFKVEPAFSEMTYEYGEEISRDISDYLVGTEWSLGLADLDLSGVDEMHMGTYEARVSHGTSEYVYEITIRDTIAPQIVLKTQSIYLAVDTVYDTDVVVEMVLDADVHAYAEFVVDHAETSQISFEQIGQYTIELVAKDCSGNKSAAQIDVTVDTPPYFEGIAEFYVVPNSNPDYLKAVTARDDLDGNLTECIEVDDSEVRLSQPGEYTLKYVAEDAFGLKSVQNVKVLVAEPEEIQRLIGNRQIDYRNDVIIGAPNVYDAGASEEENLQETLTYMRPAFVQLYHETKRGGYSSGSGFIMEITEDEVYICSNRHVVEKFKEWDIYFYDGTKAAGRSVGVAKGYDVGVVMIPMQEIPKELQEKLMTVHIDRTYWETLDESELKVALERVDREGGLLHVSEGVLLEVKQDFEWYDRLEHTEVTVELVHGDSGSAVVDGYGNLIGMAYAYSTDPTRYWCVPLDGILECYKEITGREPYVY